MLNNIINKSLFYKTQTKKSFKMNIVILFNCLNKMSKKIGHSYLKCSGFQKQ